MEDPIQNVIKKLQSDPRTSDITLQGVNFGKIARNQFDLFLDALLKSLALEMITIRNCKFSISQKKQKSKKDKADIKDPLFEKLFETFSQLPILTWLFFTGNKIGDTGIKFIAEKLPQFSALKCLGLEGNSIETRISELKNVIPKCRTLTTLTVENAVDEKLKTNEEIIQAFHNAIMNLQNSDYKTYLFDNAALINSRITKDLIWTGNSTILHKLANKQEVGYRDRLEEILRIHKPNPFHKNTRDETAHQVAHAVNKQILSDYAREYEVELKLKRDIVISSILEKPMQIETKQKTSTENSSVEKKRERKSLSLSLPSISFFRNSDSSSPDSQSKSSVDTIAEEKPTSPMAPPGM